jgi:serine/threonine protein kinase
MKTTYNGTYTQVIELETTEGKILLKQQLKEHVIHESFVRANFLTGARFLQTIKDSTLLTIDEVIETSDEVSIVCKNDGFQQLGVYLATQNQLSDAFLVELIKKMLAGIDTIHKNSIFHQGLNPNSFAINQKGDVKLTLFGTLEHRLYHHIPSVGKENPSIQNAIRFYSPERKEKYGAINLESEYYSIGLIIWYLKCVQLNLANTKDLVLNFPEYSTTGSVWDKVIEACLQKEPKKRPNSIKKIIELLPVVEEPISAPLIDDFPEPPTNEPQNTPPNQDETINTIPPISNKKNKILVFGIILLSLIFFGYFLFNAGRPIEKYVDPHPGTVASVPEGYSIVDTAFNSALTKEGYTINNEIQWRYYNGTWEKCEVNNSNCIWKKVDDPAYIKWLDNYFFKKINTNGYRHSEKEVKDFIISYYQFLDKSIELNRLGDFFEPLLSVYYSSKNIYSSYAVSEISNALNSHSVKHELNPNTFNISYSPTSATVQFKLLYSKKNKYNGQTSTVTVNSCVVVSNNLKILSIYNRK